MDSILDALEHGAQRHPEKTLFSFLDLDGRERDTYTYVAFHERTRHLAEHLRLRRRLGHGDRVLLVYPPGLELIVAFLACARIGVVPVPVYPPTPMSFEPGLAKLATIAGDCEAKAALTTRGFFGSYHLLLARRRLSALFAEGPALPALEWITTDDVRGVASASFRDDPGAILFLQYTSGSTSDPKGVVVGHRNVLHNGANAVDHPMVGVSWLPQYHDMGLIGYYLFPIIVGGTTHGFSPLDFLKRPALWLRTLSRVRGTYTSSPNFGFEYCLREDKLTASDVADVDLSSVRVMMNAAEPVRADTFRRFYERFAPHGLRPEAYVAAYGLAENTLAVSHHGKRILTVNKTQLQRRRLHIESGAPRNNNQLGLVSCGRPVPGVEVRIVDPESARMLGDDRIGEIWLAGESRCAGYWGKAELSREVFGAHPTGDAEGSLRFLRTGDLGFVHEGELYVCGRIKDVIIIRGVNYYPQDIEAIVEAASPKIRPGCVAAFDAGDEQASLVVLCGVNRETDLPDPVEIARAVRSQYYVEPATIAFLPHRAVPRTTSGKISRNRARLRFLRDELPILARHAAATRPDATLEAGGLKERFQYIVELYNLTGREEYTFAEIGIDSLTMVEILADIKALLEEHGAGALVDEVDIRLLQRLTIADFFSLVGQFERASDEPIAALTRVLRRIRSEHVSYETERMRSDAELALASHAAPPGARRPVEQVLLTGATGFFGPFLLTSLLRETSHTFHVLTRATDPVHGRDRIRASLRRSRLLTPLLSEQLESRVRIVCGDLSRHDLGLKAGHWAQLATQVDAIVHNGAAVNYVLGYDALRPHNVDGTRELLRLASTGTPKAFHLVSSTFIFGWTVKDVLYERDSNPEMADLDFGYSQSKWVAEQLVLEAGRRGLPVRVYRPSLISASTGAVGSRDDIFVRLLAFILKHGIAVNAKNQLSLLPADIAADNIAALFNQDDRGGATFHVTVDDYYNMIDVTELIGREYGYAFTYLDIPDFVGEMTRRSTKDDPIYPLVDFFNRSHAKLSAMSHKRYDNGGYRAVLRRCASARPDPRLDETVSYLMRFMAGEALIPPRPSRVYPAAANQA
jgi:thioester reductase-like protein